MNIARRAFVTGGSGYVGRNLIQFLVSRGWDVCAIARSRAAIETCKAWGASRIVEGDLFSNDALKEGVAQCDVVFHSAAMLADGVQNFDESVRINRDGTRNVLEIARSAGVRRFVHVSTEAVLVGGDPIVNVDETRPRPPYPVWSYPASKSMAEEVVLAAHGSGIGSCYRATGTQTQNAYLSPLHALTANASLRCSVWCGATTTRHCCPFLSSACRTASSRGSAAVTIAPPPATSSTCARRCCWRRTARARARSTF